MKAQKSSIYLKYIYFVILQISLFWSRNLIEYKYLFILKKNGKNLTEPKLLNDSVF